MNQGLPGDHYKVSNSKGKREFFSGKPCVFQSVFCSFSSTRLFLEEKNTAISSMIHNRKTCASVTQRSSVLCWANKYLQLPQQNSLQFLSLNPM